MKVISKKNLSYWLGAIIVLFIICFVLLYFSEAQIPTIFTSSGIVAIISAIIGVLLTAFAISIQLEQQFDAEAQKDKNVKIFEQKIRVYSEFTEKMWEMFEDGKISDEELKELRTICFRKLVFYLDNEQIIKIAEQIDSIQDTTMKAAGEITHILQESLKSDNDKKSKDSDKNKKSSALIKLFNSFDKKEFAEKEESAQVIIEQNQNTVQELQQVTTEVQYWHFNILIEEQQIKAFKNNNWVLALIEYGEDWRTNMIRQVKPNDVIFLFQRGGVGYIGAFRALDPPAKILEAETTYSDAEYAKYDIYDGIDDGASLASNILVEPIAFNFKGIGYYTVRRRTIERMNDTEAVKFLLNRFNGNDLEENRLAGKGKLDDDTKVKLNENYFLGIIKNYNL
jgi:hypothetical protein